MRGYGTMFAIIIMLAFILATILVYLYTCHRFGLGGILLFCP